MEQVSSRASSRLKLVANSEYPKAILDPSGECFSEMARIGANDHWRGQLRPNLHLCEEGFTVNHSDNLTWTRHTQLRHDRVQLQRGVVDRIQPCPVCPCCKQQHSSIPYCGHSSYLISLTPLSPCIPSQCHLPR